MSDLEIGIRVDERDGIGRRGEAVRIGVPLPRGAEIDAAALTVVDVAGNLRPHQFRVLARWPDRSIKWLLMDALVSIDARGREVLRVCRRSEPSASTPDASAVLQVAGAAGDIVVDTGRAQFHLAAGKDSVVERVVVDGRRLLDPAGARLALTDARGQRRLLHIDSAAVEESGAVRATVRLAGSFGRDGDDCPLRVRVRATFVANSSAMQLEVRLHNPRAARHLGGLWDLGDPGSYVFEDCSLQLRPAEQPARLRWYAESPEQSREAPAADGVLYQDSSGGERWDSVNHVAADGSLTVSFRGYEARGSLAQDATEPVQGLRATPCLQIAGPGGWMAASVRDFWQNFPKALRFAGGALEVALFPTECRAPFELQGGERKRHAVLLDFGLPDDALSIPALQRPLHAAIDPDAVERSAAVPYFTVAPVESIRAHLEYVRNIVEGPRAFVATRELIDEYGWRNFGDTFADHEAVRHSGTEPFVSHYNNQYDGVYAAAFHWLRTADARWRQLMDEGARHVADIDLYHTTEDRPSYNGGLFWHTDHYRTAGTASHRAYSRSNAAGAGYGGGPSNEQNYSSGLLHHHWLTGDGDSAEGVITLADWVIAMDDGSRTLLGFVDAGPTGAASATVFPDYHKPGRGPGNGINSCLDAYALTGARRYMAKAEELIQRCIHPADDIGALGLDEPEHRWSYLVFLQVLGKYLDAKKELGEVDYAFAYARDALLHYARWIAAHEVPYKDVLHKVLIPTETWPAHDVRKAHVLNLAAKYGPAAERRGFRERAEFFQRRCIEDVLSFPTAVLARPLVILAVYGPVQAWFERHADVVHEPVPHNHDFGAPVPFVPQRARLRAALPARARVVRQELARIWREGWRAVKGKLRA